MTTYMYMYVYIYAYDYWCDCRPLQEVQIGLPGRGVLVNHCAGLHMINNNKVIEYSDPKLHLALSSRL